MELISQILTHLLAAGAGAFIALTLAEAARRNEFKHWLKQSLKHICKN